MWQARPVLYEVISKGYSNRNKRMVALTEIAEEFGTTILSTGESTTGHPDPELIIIVSVMLVKLLSYLK